MGTTVKLIKLTVVEVVLVGTAMKLIKLTVV